MMYRPIVFTIAAFALAGSAAFAASPSPSAVKAAQEATQKARAATYALIARGGSATNLGTVTLQRIGSTRSRIRIVLANPAAAGSRVTLRSGSDCHDPHFAAAPHPMLLNPFTGRVSQTVVAVPLADLRSGKYTVGVQSATARQQFLDACAALSGP